MAHEEIPAYVGFCKCGNCIFAAVDDPAKSGDKAYQKDLSHAIGREMRAGLKIERSTVGWVRKNFKLCECPERKRRAKK